VVVVGLLLRVPWSDPELQVGRNQHYWFEFEDGAVEVVIAVLQEEQLRLLC